MIIDKTKAGMLCVFSIADTTTLVSTTTFNTRRVSFPGFAKQSYFILDFRTRQSIKACLLRAHLDLGEQFWLFHDIPEVVFNAHDYRLRFPPEAYQKPAFSRSTRFITSPKCVRAERASMSWVTFSLSTARSPQPDVQLSHQCYVV
jgi:hypothetical protein